MISNLSAAMIDEISLDDLAAMSTSQLQIFQKEIDAAQKLWKARNDALQAALDSKYGEKATAMRHAKGNDSGTVHVIEGNLDINCALTKRVTWDQEKLRELRGRIAAHGENPDAYMVTEYDVHEAAYKDWSKEIKLAFEPARTVKTDKPKYTIKEKETK